MSALLLSFPSLADENSDLRKQYTWLLSDFYKIRKDVRRKDIKKRVKVTIKLWVPDYILP